MNKKIPDGLVDRIYEAALMPDHWPDVLSMLGEIAGCDKSVLFATNHGRNVNAWIGNEAIREPMERMISEGWASQNDIAPRAVARKEPDFTMDLDLITREEIDNSPFYQKFMIPNGMAWGTGTAIQSNSDDVMIFALHRALELGPVPREAVMVLTELRPYLARAALMTTRLRLEQAKMAVKTMESLGLPAIALRSDRRVSIMNSLCESLIPNVVQDRQGRLLFPNGESDRLFSKALHQNEKGRSFPAVGLKRERIICHLVPVAGAARDIFRAMDFILVFVAVALREQFDQRVIQSLFDLTPAEATIASSLIQGKTVEQIALDRSTSIETVRSQLKSTMAKTGTSRQVELVRLLSVAQWPSAKADPS